MRRFSQLLGRSATSALLVLMGTSLSSCGFVSEFLSIDLQKSKTPELVSEKIIVNSSTATLGITEGSQSAILFILNKKLTEDVTLTWTLNGAGTFASHSGTVNLLKDAENFSVTLDALNDAIYFPLRTYDFTITLPTDVFQSSDLDIEVRLTDNDSLPTFSFQAATQSVSEGVGNASVTVTSTQTAGVATQLSLGYAGTATNSNDYTQVTTVNFPAGQNSVTVNIPIVDDADTEASETVDIALTGTSLGTIGVNDAHEIEIVDNEIVLGAFVIDGITGNTDSTEDAFLNSTVNPTVHWQASSDATSYDVTVLDAAGAVTVCATENTAGLSHSFGACNLIGGQTYRARVVAKAGGTSLDATNSTYSFLVNRAPSVTGETLTMMYNGAAITFNPVANDSDLDGHTVTVTAVGAASKGATALLSGTSVRYTPTGNFSNVGMDSFTYTVSDGNGGTATGTVTVRLMTVYTWIGAVDNTWSTPGNWCGTVASPGLSGTCPGGTAPNNAATASHKAFFNSTVCSGASCNVNIADNAQAQTIEMQSDFTGTITQQATRTLTIGTGGFVQNGGTFVGGNADILVGGDVFINAGNFASTSATLNVYYSSLTIAAAANFSHSSGTVKYTGEYNGTEEMFTFNNKTLYNFTIESERQSTLNLNGSTVTVMGTLTCYSLSAYNSVDNGTIEAKGNIEIPESDEGGHFGSWGGTALIRISGSGNQYISGYGTDSVSPPMEIASTGGTVVFAGTIEIRYGFKYVQGDVDLSDSTIEFIGMYNEDDVDVDAANLEFNNVHIESSRYSSINIIGSLTVKGDLSIDDYNNYTTVGIINVEGDVTFGANFSYPSVAINLVGSGNQTIGRNASPEHMLAVINVNKTGGIATMTSNITLLGGAAGDFSLNTGTFNLNGFTLTVPDTLTLGSGTTLQLNGGSYSAGTFVNNGATIL